MKHFTVIALLVVVLLGGCTTENEKTVTPNQACAGHGGVKALDKGWTRDNIGWNGNEPDGYTAVICRDGFLATAVNWQ